MKNDITSLDLYYLVKEFQVLIGGKIEKIFQGKDDKKDLLFRFHIPSTGKKMLRFKLPSLVYLTETKEDYPENPPGFCMFLRKYLGGARLKAIRQEGFERVLVLTFEKYTAGKPVIYHLIIELFSRGNMALCDNEMKIKNPLENQHWTGREIRTHQQYLFPPTQANTPALQENDIITLIKNSDKESIVKTLAIDTSLGGEYAEEALARAKVTKDKKQSVLTGKEQKQIAQAVLGLFHEHINAQTAGNTIAPFVLITKEAQKSHSSFSEALDEHFTKSPEHKEVEAHKEKVAKIDIIIKEQEQKIAGFATSAEENQRKGELIYEHYTEIKEILSTINEARKKYSWKEIKDRVKGHKTIKEIDEKKGTITLEY
ncbi:MAG: NFACT family protein [Nanoarchaeota archaeon]